MRHAVVVLALVGIVACGSGKSGGSGGAGGGVPKADLTNFTGQAWSGTQSTSGTCNGNGSQPYNPTSFIAKGSDGLTFTSAAGCLFDFSVSGDEATLSNAPVVCSTTSNGGAVVFNYTEFTMTSSDGAHLTALLAGTLKEGGKTCSFKTTVSAQR